MNLLILLISLMECFDGMLGGMPGYNTLMQYLDGMF
jgi:hypothetical protein